MLFHKLLWPQLPSDKTQSASTYIFRFNGHFSRWTYSPYPLFLNCESFWDRPKLSMSFLTQPHQVFLGHPLCLIPSTSHTIQCLTQSLSSLRSTCPHHLNLLFLIIKLTGSNPKSSSLFILLFSLTSHIYLITTHFSVIQLQFSFHLIVQFFHGHLPVGWALQSCRLRVVVIRFIMSKKAHRYTQSTLANHTEAK